MEARTLTLSIERSGVRVDHLIHDSRDRKTHYTTAYSCDCSRFAQRGACLHHAMLLDSRGWNAAPASAAAIGMEISR
jgi:hypothetical protein